MNRWFLLFCVLSYGLGNLLRAETVRYLKYPALSPDATQISFSYGGDLFLASVQGGIARKITTHPAYEGVSLWSPDGRFLLFESDRRGNIDIFRMDLRTGETVALTFFEKDEKLCDFSSEGSQIIFSAVYDHPYPHRPMLYQMPITGGNPERLLNDFSAFGMFAPHGNKLFYTRGQIDWWRQGYRGSANEEIYSYDFSTQRYEKLTSHSGQDRCPMPLAEDHFFYLSDENISALTPEASGNGILNLLEWKATQKKQVTFHQNDSVQFPRMNATRTHLIYSCDGDIYCYSLLQQTTTRIEIAPFLGEQETGRVEEAFQGNIEDFTATTDGEHFLVSARGELFRFYRPRHGKTWPAQPLAEHIARDENPVFTQEGLEAFFVSERSGSKQLYRVISEEAYLPLSLAQKSKIQNLSLLTETAFNLLLSPDQKKLAFVRNTGELVVRYLLTGEEKVLVEEENPPENYCWSPDSQWIAYEAEDENFNHDVFLVSLQLGEILNLSEHPDYDGRPSWSPDGTRIVFVSRRHGESEEIFLSVLDKTFYESSETEEIRQEIRKKYQLLQQKKTQASSPKKSSAKKTKPSQKKQVFWNDPKMEPSEFLWDFFSRTYRKPAPKKPPEETSDVKATDWRWVNVDVENIASRLRRLTYSLEEENNPVWDPYALGIFFCADPASIKTASSSRTWDLYYLALPSLQIQRVTVDGMSPEKIKVIGRSLYFLSKGTLYQMLLGASHQGLLQWNPPQKIPFRGVLRYLPEQRRSALLAEVWAAIHENFYDLHFNGKSWPALGWKYARAVPSIRHSRDLEDLLNQMLGELNTSHLSYHTSTKNRTPTGILGVQYEKVPEGLQIMEVTPGGPCDQTENQIVLGEILIAVDGYSLLEYPLHQLLQDKIDQEIRLTLKNEEQIREIKVRPISWNEFERLSYREYSTRNREYIEQYSRRKLGYIHLSQMTPGSFEIFEQELYQQSLSEKRGLILDIRNNRGGWYADYFWMALNFPKQIWTQRRNGLPGYPWQRRPFYGWQKPILLLTNEYTVSNAEIFACLIKTQRRGKIVGTSTAGQVVSAKTIFLLDGSTLQIPYLGWSLSSTGGTLENIGLQPDYEVFEAPGEFFQGEDTQLREAIQQLLSEIPK